MPEVHDRNGAKSTEGILTDFDCRREQFFDLCKTTKALIERILTEKEIFFHSVQARVKKREKLKLKYSAPDREYKSLDEVSDVVGLRVITFYADAIDHVGNIVRGEFRLLGSPDDKRIAKASEFGYSALHLDCAYSQTSLERTEYKPFEGLRFEIQMTTILGHAWAEMHHGWYDNKSGVLSEDE